MLWGLPWVPLVYWFTVVRNFVTVMQRPNIVTICAVAGLPVSFLLELRLHVRQLGRAEAGRRRGRH